MKQPRLRNVQGHRWGLNVGLTMVQCAALFMAGPALAQVPDDGEPLSAIEWLSETVEQPALNTSAGTPVPGTQATRTPPAGEAPVARSATTPDVRVQPLGGPAPRVIGVLRGTQSGLAPELWQGSDPETLAALIAAQPQHQLPALTALLETVILTEAAPPATDFNDVLLTARVDRLLSQGALEPALALIEAAGPESTPAIFRRWFDVTLLTGTEDRACRVLQTAPDVAPTPQARVFCLARSGDWTAAALTLNTARALGDMDAATADLLARFLDPELFEGADELSAPQPVTPLNYRMFEAIGQPLGSAGLPLAFAHADLRPNVGWKAQLEAAERLAARGALADAALIGLYTARRPAASGGVWERARAVQGLDRTLRGGGAPAQARAQVLTDLWSETKNPGTLVPVARHFGPLVLQAAQDAQDAQSTGEGTAPWDAEARAALFRLLLLSNEYEAAAGLPIFAETAPFEASLAQSAPDATLASTPRARAIAAAFMAEPDQDLMEIAASGRLGEAILRSLATIDQGLQEDDTETLGRGLASLRALGLEDAARRTALQFVLLTP